MTDLTADILDSEGGVPRASCVHNGVVRGDAGGMATTRPDVALGETMMRFLDAMRDPFEAALWGPSRLQKTLMVRQVLLPIACQTSSREGGEARSCLVVSQAPSRRSKGVGTASVAPSTWMQPSRRSWVPCVEYQSWWARSPHPRSSSATVSRRSIPLLRTWTR